MDQQGLDARLQSVWLRQSVAEFVLEGFLPQLWVDLRGRWVVKGHGLGRAKTPSMTCMHVSAGLLVERKGYVAASITVAASGKHASWSQTQPLAVY